MFRGRGSNTRLWLAAAVPALNIITSRNIRRDSYTKLRRIGSVTLATSIQQTPTSPVSNFKWTTLVMSCLALMEPSRAFILSTSPRFSCYCQLELCTSGDQLAQAHSVQPSCRYACSIADISNVVFLYSLLFGVTKENKSQLRVGFLLSLEMFIDKASCERRPQEEGAPIA